MCREVFEILKTLKRTRDMSVNEIKLIVAIEDPRARERRAQGIEDDRGVSRDEMAAALLEVAEGRVPKDRIALKCLFDEMQEWPFLEVNSAAAVDDAAAAAAAAGKATAAGQAAGGSASGSAGSDYASLMGGDTVVRPYIMGNEARKGDKPQTLADYLPDWVGYGALYGISAIPVFLAGGCVLILFYNSLR